MYAKLLTGGTTVVGTAHGHSESCLGFLYTVEFTAGIPGKENATFWDTTLWKDAEFDVVYDSSKALRPRVRRDLWWKSFLVVVVILAPWGALVVGGFLLGPVAAIVRAHCRGEAKVKNP
ncbi:MAG: hypothetical protein ACI8W8_004074 [Rhodothermales bacterium]|jgi:hypothetical protein